MSVNRSVLLNPTPRSTLRGLHCSDTRSSFINPPVFGSPPDLSVNTKQGRMALSAHFYDGLTLLGKRRHKFNAVSERSRFVSFR